MSPTKISLTPQDESEVSDSECDALRVHNMPSGAPSSRKTIESLARARDRRSVSVFVSPQIVPESSDKVPSFLGEKAVAERRKIT